LENRRAACCAPLPTLDSVGIIEIEELKRAKDQRPFLPITIRMADGREIRVTHPDVVSLGGDQPRVAICSRPNGGRDLNEVALITSLGMSAPSEAEPTRG
jgi:hypothetical protein